MNRVVVDVVVVAAVVAKVVAVRTKRGENN